MLYINPIEILSLQGVDIKNIASTTIKKAKKMLFADIDLSDSESFEYYDRKLTKSDCELAVEALEDKNKLLYYYTLCQSDFKPLNKFLAATRTQLPTNIKQESILSLPAGFIPFISPFFAAKLGFVLLKSFQGKDIELFSQALRSAECFVSKSDLNNAYKSLSREIQQRIAEIDKLSQEIKEKNHLDENSIDDESVINKVTEKFPIEFINKLPLYFQSQINKAGEAINFLQISIWDAFNTTAVPLALLEHLTQLNITGVLSPTIQKNYRIVKEKHQERIEQEKNAPLILKWSKIILSIQKKIKEIETLGYLEIKSTPSTALLFIEQSIDLNELNQLPGFANEIRTQIALLIRGMSVVCWNKYKEDNNLCALRHIDSCLSLINYALNIKVEENIKSGLQKDKEQLEKIRRGQLMASLSSGSKEEKDIDEEKEKIEEYTKEKKPNKIKQKADKDLIRRITCIIGTVISIIRYLILFSFMAFIIGAITGGIILVIILVIGHIISPSHDLLNDLLEEGYYSAFDLALTITLIVMELISYISKRLTRAIIGVIIVAALAYIITAKAENSTGFMAIRIFIVGIGGALGSLIYNNLLEKNTEEKKPKNEAEIEVMVKGIIAGFILGGIIGGAIADKGLGFILGGITGAVLAYIIIRNKRGYGLH